MSTIKNRKGGDLNISVSAIETFEDCKRKWWYGYVERIRGEKSEAALRGDKIHTLAERYLKGEINPDTLEGEDAMFWEYLEPGLQYAPSPEDVAEQGWNVERWVKEPCGPLTFVGKVDIDHPGNAADPPVIADWKTTGHKKWYWSKTPSKLWAFLQPRAYAYALHKNNPPPYVLAQHINLQSKGVPDAMEVWAADPKDGSLGIPWSEVLDTWDYVVSKAEQMAAIATNNEEPTDVEANTKSCKKFGGCEYASICPASPQNRATPNIPQVEIEPMSVNEDLAAKRAALLASLGMKAAPAPTITPEPKVQPAEPPPTKSPKEQVEKVLSAMGGIPARVFQQLAGTEMHAVASELGLALDPADNVYRKRHVEPPTVEKADPVQVFDQWGLSQREWERTNGTTCPPNTKVVAGIIVPGDFDGTTAEAIERWGTPAQKAASEVLEANDPSDTPPAPAPTDTSKYDVDTRKAARLILEVLKDKESVDKGDASDIVRNNTTWKRVSKNRWVEVAECASAIAGRPVVYDEEDGSLSWTDPAPTTEIAFDTTAIAETAPVPLIELVEAEEELQADFAYSAGFADGKAAAADDIGQAIAEAEARGYEKGLAAAGDRPSMVPPDNTGLRTVYINCLPTHTDYVDFAAFIAEAEALVAKEEGVAYYGLLSFGQGPKQVAAKLANLLKREGIRELPEHLVIDSFHPCASDCIAILSATPGIAIVRAIR